MKNEIKLRWLVTGSFLSSVGTSFIWPLTTIYLHNELHQSLTIIGFVLLLYSGTNVVGSYLSGMLFDRFNPRTLILSGLIIDTVAMFVLIFINHWPVYPIFLSIIGFFNGWLTTLINSLGTLIGSRDGRYIFNMLYFAANLGIVLGTSVVGFVYHGSVAPMFTLTTILYVFYFVVAFLFYHVDTSAIRKKHQRSKTKVSLTGPNVTIMWTFFISLGIIWVMYEQWVSNLSVYVTDMGIPMELYSLLWTINAGLIVLLQILMNWMAHFVKNIYLQVYVGIFFCAGSFIILMFAHNYAMFVLAMVILTVGEATAFPTMPAIINDLSPVDVKGKYQGMMNAFSSAGKAIGPLFGGMIIEGLSYQSLFVVCSVSIVLVGIVVILIVNWQGERAQYYR
ncbi:MDR family MFS transporter [Paucilactobacillus wasatchensis]|uniref:Permease of the major facilitator superfamily n=1 Tax=Paucilactobacillus wasatchensis TaxID=1335616 RepID=A0A0D0YVU8_9LACO|nr:MFS transporter [Paucilactobacillus wasatchensis]KIS03404.1 permease of the major facilitator superfamily [Paucilactobacillus wasatchensis]